MAADSASERPCSPQGNTEGATFLAGMPQNHGEIQGPTSRADSLTECGAVRDCPLGTRGLQWRHYIALRYNEKRLSEHDRILGMKKLSLADYQALAEFRYQIRRFLSFSDQAVQDAGLERGQYQLMLTIKGMPEGMRPRIRDLANRLRVKHNSAVELINRLEAGGYVHRERAEDDRREVLLALTGKGEKVLGELALHHHQQLQESAPRLVAALKSVMKRKQEIRTIVAKDHHSGKAPVES